MRLSKSYLALLSLGLSFTAQAIEGDLSITREDYPHNVLLNSPRSNINQSENITRVCNATVFAHKWVITSEHCVLSEPRLADNGILNCDADDLTSLQEKACAEALPIVNYGDSSENNGWVNVGIKQAISTYIDSTDSGEAVEEPKLLNPLNANFEGTPGENVYTANLVSGSPQAIAFIEMVEAPGITGTGYFAIPSEYDFALSPSDELTLFDDEGDPLNYFQVIAFKDTTTEEVAAILGTEAYDPFTYDPLKTNGVTFKPLDVALDVARGGDYWSHDGSYVGLASNLYTYASETGDVTRGYGSAGAFRTVDENNEFNNQESAFGNGGAAVTRLTKNGDYDIVGVLYGSESYAESTLGAGDSSCSTNCETYQLITYASLRYEPARNRLLHYVNAINAPKVISSKVDEYTTKFVRLQNLSKGQGVGLLEEAQPRNIREVVKTTGNVSVLNFYDEDGSNDEYSCTDVSSFGSCYLEVEFIGDGAIEIGFEDGNQPNQSILIQARTEDEALPVEEDEDEEKQKENTRPSESGGSIGWFYVMSLLTTLFLRRK